MKRSAPLKRTSPLKARPSKRLEPERPLAVWCEVQLGGCEGRAVLRHERIRRAQGGKGSRANCLDLCHWCSDYIHGHITESLSKGWLLSSWQDPERVPVSLSPNVLEPRGVE